MVKNPEYAGQSTAGKSTEIPQILLEIMQEYCRTQNEVCNRFIKDRRGTDKAIQDCLVHKTLRLHAIHHFMGRLLSFTPECTEQLLQSWGWQNSPQFKFFSSRLLTRQIKFAMHLVHRSLNDEVLRQLHDGVRKKSPELWTSSFCTILILCLCAEELQVAVDGFTTFTISRQSGSSKRASQNGLETCRRLDETIEMFMDVFHDVYSTRKKPKKAKSGGLNPILNGPGSCENMDYGAASMVRKVKEVIESNSSSPYSQPLYKLTLSRGGDARFEETCV